MATGDITTVTIDSSGYYASMKVLGFVVGATYSPGTAPANYKAVFTVVSKGFDATGAATTYTRSVYGTFVRYKENPPANSYARDETTSGSDVIFTIALSEPIYIKDNTGAGNSGTAVVVNIASGLVVNTAGGAQSSNALVSGAVTNNSTLTYPKACACWLTTPYKLIPSGNFSVDVMAFADSHGYAANGVACVKFTLADGTVTRNSTVTTMTLGADSGFPAYSVTDACSNFTQSANITCRAQVYPIIGDTTEVRDSNDVTFDGTLGFATLPVGVCDKGGTYGVTYCAVNSSTGNDATGVASNVKATAEASPVQTISKAMKKIQDYNNSNYSRNTVDAGIVLLINGGHLYGVGGETINAHTAANLTITRSSTTKAGDARITGFNATSRYGPAHVRLYDMAIVPSSSSNHLIGFFGANAHTAVVENVKITGVGSTTALFSGNSGKAHMWWKNVTISGFTDGISTGNDQCASLALNCEVNDTACVKAFEGVMNVVGCTGRGAGTTNFLKTGGKSWTDPGNHIFAFNRSFGCVSQFLTNTEAENLSDVFVVGNVAERIGSDPSSLIEFSGAVLNNVHFWHNTAVGQRTNLTPDIVTPLVDKLVTNMSVKNNSWSRFATTSHSDDTAMTMLGMRAFQYGVGRRHDNQEDDSLGLAGFYKGDDFITGAASYTRDASYTGSDAGYGDYVPQSGSALLGRLTSSGDILVPYLMRGDWQFQAVTAGAAAAVGALQRPAASGGGTRVYAS